MDQFVYDNLDNRYERKNLYLKDLVENDKVDKNTHPYILKLNEIKKLEQDLFKNIEQEKKNTKKIIHLN